MNKFTPRNIALAVSIFISLIVVLLTIISSPTPFDKESHVPLIFIGLGTLASSYLLLFAALKILIYDKIKRIYTTIHDLKSSKDFSMENLDLSKDIFTKINTDVSQWAVHNKNEIEQLKKLELYRREFVGNVSHELKTPIFNIQGYILTLLDGGLHDDSINMDYLTRASKSVERMISIVEDLDTISQMESGELKLEYEKFDIVALANEVLIGSEMRASSRNIKLQFDENYTKPIMVSADKHFIRQVISNLVVNSIRYGKQGGQTTIKFNDLYQHVVVEVIDNGIGIAKHHLPRIFERFFRLDKSRSREHGGTGLGLAIVKHIIEAHNQTIDVKSTEGEGSVFTFTVEKA
ncbi:MAG: sensor histidine kinase [Bacteroidia bacterium]|nr:sensor histidine kinase [Bacteroidia bacterium]